jgi:hypothetical protein
VFIAFVAFWGSGFRAALDLDGGLLALVDWGLSAGSCWFWGPTPASWLTGTSGPHDLGGGVLSGWCSGLLDVGFRLIRPDWCSYAV